MPTPADQPASPLTEGLGANRPASADFAEEVLAKLAGRTTPFARYRVQNEVAVGGMGTILRVWDGDLRRNLAMKVVLERPTPPGKSGTAAGEPQKTGSSNVDKRMLARFIEEAQVTSQLDHPGIPPVHELGLDDRGRVYFTMRLVAGRDLEKILALVRDGEEDWTQTRAVGVLLKVCEAMAYAHTKNVIHRDLKPANVMVGRFGEVYVMDWGLARVLGRADESAVRLKRHPDSSMSIVLSDRRDARDSGAAGSAMVTMDGDVLGTPAYMSPEQAHGDLENMGPASDVFSVGAILYHLLAGHMPYRPPGRELNAYAAWGLVQAGPPEPLAEHAPDAPAELVAICEKAMAREPAERYASMLEFAEDLRAYLEQRVVHAYETGAIAEFRKWVKRNRALAATVMSALVMVLVGLSLTAWMMTKKNAELAHVNAERLANEKRALESARIAEERADQVLRLSDVTQLQQLERSADELWPAIPSNAEAYTAWLEKARGLAKRLDLHRRTLDDLRENALPSEPSSATLAPHFAFSKTGDQWEHDMLADLVAKLEAFSDPEHGEIAAMEARLEFARTLPERTLTSADAQRAWIEAVASIRDPSHCPAYHGLAIAPQLGLLPIGRDPHSGLWEFAHLQTGAIAKRDPSSGALEIGGDTGIVFVLLPGGWFWMGAQSRDPAGPNFDPQATPAEGPPEEVELAPFFLSKYETTQGQWLRFTGSNPSAYLPGKDLDGKVVTLRHPVEQVSWLDCADTLRRLGLVLPTEAQWEYAARAGTDTPWSTGSDKESLMGAVNFADQSAARLSPNWTAIEELPELLDGYPAHAPVGIYTANPFGLHDMHGNVWEWCRDLYAQDYSVPVSKGDGERQTKDVGFRANRGGSFVHSATQARSSNRNPSAPELRQQQLGFRAARSLSP